MRTGDKENSVCFSLEQNRAAVNWVMNYERHNFTSSEALLSSSDQMTKFDIKTVVHFLRSQGSRFGGKGKNTLGNVVCRTTRRQHTLEIGNPLFPCTCIPLCCEDMHLRICDYESLQFVHEAFVGLRHTSG